ncbi:MAG: hypothetical protein Q8L68_00990, partial [Methylococcales bacterium]|nr:hypothetical protein [Methylococcales bacterium]
ASKATLAFCEPVKIFRVFPLIFNLDFRIGYTLNYCPDFGVHYSSCTPGIVLMSICHYPIGKFEVG